MPPGPRAGFSMCVHKRRALLFGGVVDMEVEGEYLNCHEWDILSQILCFLEVKELLDNFNSNWGGLILNVL